MLLAAFNDGDFVFLSYQAQCHQSPHSTAAQDQNSHWNSGEYMEQSIAAQGLAYWYDERG